MTAASDLQDTALRALVCLDLTNLDDKCDTAAVADLCKRAQTPHGSVAAVCVWPRFVAQAKAALAHTGIRVATVVNFPSGDADVASVEAETRAALADGADEIDMVVPWRKLAAGDEAAVTEMVQAIKAVCGGKTLKAILETGELADPALIAVASKAAIAGGADFLKTSTGKTATGATPEAARMMIEAIARTSRFVGFKASGGVRTVPEAAVYLDFCDKILGAGSTGPKGCRIGASSLLDAILATIGDDDGEFGDDGDY